jgi:hypothetical protein
MNMKYRFDKAPTREAMIREFGADPERLAHAEESIRQCAVNPDDFEYGKEHYRAGEIAHILVACGIAEAFALLCIRLGGIRGLMNILPTWLGAPVQGLLRVTAEFEESGTLKAMKGTLDTGEPFGLNCDGMSIVPPSEVGNAEWQAERWAMIRDYEAERASLKNYPWPELVTVIRFPLSVTQAYRKFLTERWHDPDIPIEERFECPLDRLAFERFETYVESLSARFEKEIASVA